MSMSMSLSSRRPTFPSSSSSSSNNALPPNSNSNSRLDAFPPSPAASTSQFSATSGYGGAERERERAGGGGGGTDSRSVARDHWQALRSFLLEFLKKEPPNSRANAREKLTRLTRQQFQELSTDVYDELMRRVGDGGPDSPGEVPFLPLRPDFHPKRNQARQKLATLPKSRFKDLASDVYYELNRRYPEFSEPEQPEPQPRSPSSNYSASTPITPGYPPNSNNNNNQYNDPYPPTLPSNSNFNDNANSSSNAPRPSSNRSRDSNERERSYITSPTSSQPSGTSRPPYQTSNRQASITRTLSSSSNPGGLPPPSNFNNSSTSSNSNNPPSSFITTSTIVPNKSTIAEEDIQVPYARDSHPSSSSPPPTETLGSPNLGGGSETGGGGGEYYDRMSFGSATSRARGNTGAGGGGNWDREREELKREYEYRIANLTGKLGVLEGGVESAKEAEGREREGRERAERDMDAVKEQLATFNESLRTLGRELDETRSAASREKEKVRTLETQLREAAEDHERALNEERENRGSNKEGNGGQSSNETLTDLKSQVQDLVQELNSLSLMHEELHRERENDQLRIRQAEERAREMEQKWRSTKTELRNLKATSQMFVSAPRTEDHLPASSTGALADINVTAFQTSIDGLITAARSTTPTSVLGAMKPVIGAMANISLDVQAFEDRPPSSRIHVDMSALQSLKDRSTQNLNILTHSAKEFAMSYGLSPISLLDAAASELAANVVGLFKLLGIRRADKKEVERLMEQAPKGGLYSDGNGSSSSIATSRPTAVAREGGGPSTRRPDSTASNQSGTTDRYDARSSTGTARGDPAPSSANLSSRMDPRRMTSTSSIGSAFDLERKPSTTGTDSGSVGGGGGGRRVLDRNMGSWDSRASNGGGGGGFQPPTSLLEERDESDRDEEEEEELDDDGDRAWVELKPYLDTQSESLIQAIQTLLSSVRSGEPTPQLRDHLSSVIVLGSSIVGVSKDSLPLRSLGEGRRLLRELAGNCDALSELSEGGEEEMGKGKRNRIAQTTFELAKNLKNLMNL
ncbi:hypothetical protein BDY24DRAFT_391588 [Mrakia frigida]|uniref:uncharacterized protein n=1 Tax=Mrakia frigida TaxID=29902 RepID=UPI003FCC0603